MDARRLLGKAGMENRVRRESEEGPTQTAKTRKKDKARIEKIQGNEIWKRARLHCTSGHKSLEMRKEVMAAAGVPHAAGVV